MIPGIKSLLDSDTTDLSDDRILKTPRSVGKASCWKSVQTRDRSHLHERPAVCLMLKLKRCFRDYNVTSGMVWYVELWKKMWGLKLDVEVSALPYSSDGSMMVCW